MFFMADVSAKNVVSRAVWRGVAWFGLVLSIPANLSNRGKSFDLNAVQPKDSHDFLKHGLVAG